MYEEGLCIDPCLEGIAVIQDTVIKDDCDIHAMLEQIEKLTRDRKEEGYEKRSA